MGKAWYQAKGGAMKISPLTNMLLVGAQRAMKFPLVVRVRVLPYHYHMEEISSATLANFTRRRGSSLEKSISTVA